MKEVDCEFRTRLAPAGKTDYWWKYGGLFNSPTKSVRHLIETYLEYGEPYFQRYQTVQDIAAMIPLEDLHKEGYLFVLGGTTTQRAALTMARIHAHLGNSALAKQYATTGLENIGSVTGLKSEFEKILNKASISP